MEDIGKKALFVILAAVVVFGSYFYFRSQPGNDARQDVIAELKTFAEFDDHRELLLAALDAAHDDVAWKLTRRQGGRRAHFHSIDREAYRSETYAAMANALRQAGHDRASMRLLEHQAAVKR
jgi:hypothetical protein